MNSGFLQVINSSLNQTGEFLLPLPPPQTTTTTVNSSGILQQQNPPRPPPPPPPPGYFSYFQSLSSGSHQQQYPLGSYSANPLPLPSPQQQTILMPAATKIEPSSPTSNQQQQTPVLHHRGSSLRSRPSIESIKKSLRDRDCFLNLDYQKAAIRELFEAVQQSNHTLQLLQAELLRQQPYLHNTEHCNVVIRFDSTRTAFFEFHYSSPLLPWAAEDVGAWVKHLDEELVVYSTAIYEVVKEGIERQKILDQEAGADGNKYKDGDQLMMKNGSNGAGEQTASISISTTSTVTSITAAPELEDGVGDQQKKKENNNNNKNADDNDKDKFTSLVEKEPEKLCRSSSSENQSSSTRTTTTASRPVTRNSTGSRLKSSTAKIKAETSSFSSSKPATNAKGRGRASLSKFPPSLKNTPEIGSASTFISSLKRPFTDSEDEEIEENDLHSGETLSSSSLQRGPLKIRRTYSSFVPRRNIFEDQGPVVDLSLLLTGSEEDEEEETNEDEDSGAEEGSEEESNDSFSSLDKDKVEQQKPEEAKTKSKTFSPKTRTRSSQNKGQNNSSSKSTPNTSVQKRVPGRPPRNCSTQKSTYPSRRAIPCPHCSQIFSRKFSLDRHIEGSHEGRKPWACTWPGCGYLCSQEFQTLVHIDRKHLQPKKALAGSNPRAFIKKTLPGEVEEKEKEEGSAEVKKEG